ncbi:MAG: hypothetical protein ED557_11485 [Balneola sp.]|nr:MAG: hypothetical protein ED557_11485 [Balneola sp.]
MCKCESCGVEEGQLRPIGKYIVELHQLEYKGSKMDLCLTCYRHYKMKLTRVADKEQRGFDLYSNFKKLYQQAFHTEHKD